jgi:16S rRNA (uracil1498-N3)-methyltransferase
VLERFYCPAPPVDGLAILEGNEARHLIRVRRVAVGEIVELFDGRGSAYRAQVSSIARDQAILQILETAREDQIPRFSIALATAVPKGDRFDWLVEKATELGVDRLIPLVTERSVVDPRSAKLDRLRRVIVEASKQCRRNRLMDLEPPTTWNSMVEAAPNSIRLIAHPGEPGIVSAGLRPGAGSAILAIGPEGGFSEGEVEQAVLAGWRPVGLGSTILRIETAALAGCSTILALMGAGAESVNPPEAT